MRRHRGSSWHQSWVWWEASLGCSNADSAGVDGYRISLPECQAGHVWVHHHSKTVWPCECKTALEVADHDEKLSLQEKKVNQLIRNAGRGETLGFFHLTQYGQGKCQEHSSGSCRLWRCSWISSELWTAKTWKLVPKCIFSELIAGKKVNGNGWWSRCWK